MIRARSLFAVLSVALLLAASDARASFNYSVVVTPTPVVFGAGNTSTYTSTPSFTSGSPSGTLTGTQTINIVQTTQTSTRVGTAPFGAGQTDQTTIPNYQAVVTINNLNGGGSANITVLGTLNITRSDTLGANSNYVLTSILPTSITLGQFTYSLSNPTYTAPTIAAGGNAGGGMSILITEAPVPGVPEPASLVMMGTSVLALGGLSVLRRRS